MVVSDGSKRDRTPPQFGVDERLIMPETRYEVVHGQVVYVMPSDPPHGSRHSKLAALLEAHIGEGFDAAVDMLTRTSEKNDFAPDASVYPRAPDPETGGRQLEHLAFEVVSTQTLANSGTKAAELVRRGVRRVFAIDVERQRALEWSEATAAWQLLRNSDALADPCFVVPLPIDALVGAGEADDAIAQALLAKGNPILGAALAQRRREGQEVGLREGREVGLREGREVGLREGREAGLRAGESRGRVDTLIALLRARGLVVEASDEARVRSGVDDATFDACLGRALTATTLDEVFG